MIWHIPRCVHTGGYNHKPWHYNRKYFTTKQPLLQIVLGNHFGPPPIKLPWSEVARTLVRPFSFNIGCSFAQWQYRSLWGPTEARLLLVENFTQYPAKDDLQYSRRWQFLTVSKETDNMFKINYPSICTAICAWWLSVLFLISYYLSVCPTWPLYYRHCLRKVSVITPRFY